MWEDCNTLTPPWITPLCRAGGGGGGRDELRRVLAECLHHSPGGTITWYPLGRMWAASFKLLGGTIPKLEDWGRWRTEK